MIEAEWPTSTEPDSMLYQIRDTATDRKLRLFAIACAKHNPLLPQDHQASWLIAMAEQYVEGAIDPYRLESARREAERLAEDYWLDAWGGIGRAILVPITVQVAVADPLEIRSVWHMAKSVWDAGDEAIERRWLASVLRDLFGNPWHPVSLDPMLRRWNGGVAVTLAQEMYESCEFSRAPLLGDMLEDAGCTDPQVLEHLRGPGPHVRGCWVVDLLLGKS
jgi:hypothetical protein